MTKTLYEELKEVENINVNINTDISNFIEFFEEKYWRVPGFEIPSFENFSGISVPDYQRKIIGCYENNPVFCDALNGKLSVEDSLNELSVVNKGIRKILPRRKDKIHNERINQIGKLIKKPYQLEKNGLFFPDNIINFMVEVGALSFLVSPSGNLLLNKISSQQKEIFNLYIPLFLTGTLGVGLGSLVNSYFRSGKLPFDEAKYVDAKIKEFYK